MHSNLLELARIAKVLEVFLTVKEEKSEIRKRVVEKLLSEDGMRTIEDVLLMQEDSEYCKTFLNRLSSYRSAKTVFAYLSMKDEFPTLGLLKQVIKDGKTLALPRVEGKELIFHKVGLENEEIVPLEKGYYNILEPKKEASVLFPNTKEVLTSLLPLLVITPGRAFSKKGERLGHGGGFYDRFFSSLFRSVDRDLVCLLGLCFSFQIFQSLPRGKYDILVDEVASEK